MATDRTFEEIRQEIADVNHEIQQAVSDGETVGFEHKLAKKIIDLNKELYSARTSCATQTQEESVVDRTVSNLLGESMAYCRACSQEFDTDFDDGEYNAGGDYTCAACIGGDYDNERRAWDSIDR